MDVRNLNAQELEEFLYDYTISLDSLDEIIEPYNDLIARASADHEKYYQRKINDFEEWKQYEKNQNLYNLENNEIYDLEKKRDSTQKFPSILLGIFGFIIGVFLKIILSLIMIPITGILSTLFLILCIMIGYNINKIKQLYFNNKIKNARKNSIQKDKENRVSDDDLKHEYQLEEQLNRIDNIYNTFIQESEENLGNDINYINSYLNELEYAIPENYQNDKVLVSHLYMYVHEGRANSWKESLNLFHEDVKHNEILDSMDILNEVVESGFNRIENAISKTNLNIKEINNQVENANLNITKLNRTFNDISSEVINLNKESLNELQQLNPRNRKQ
ncbi:DUF2273 domain-containing protein [Staphylococcus xylosus]|uniref:DUF2273 domain-containing protein n=2 Tax=Staphylococcus TaxID=1279 RepID=UPI000853A902|nr:MULTISPECIES: DUF2273 domain-containing protein [Staphylococcus]OEL06512.1 hypothetical protein AST04_13445 [Staphylococcus equorum]PTE76809.1 hypothetical protein BUY85_11150 [Staphylococcus equorum]PTK47036.1 hypothetical protein BUZ69_04630 [Staphylococcus saprophyticus]